MADTQLTDWRSKAQSPRRRNRPPIWVGWVAGAAAVGLLFVVRDQFVPWVWMWLAGGTVLLGVKALTLLRAWSCGQGLSAGRLLGYMCLWPGTDARPFLAAAPAPAKANARLWAAGLFRVAVGAAILWIGPGLLSEWAPLWLLAWVGMVGMSVLAHFGLFDLAAAAWRARGVPVETVFQAPVAATSLAEFWGKRWNRGFSDFARDLIFRPLARRLGGTVGSLGVFLFSGLMHELVISAPARGGYGGPTVYFLLQCLLVRVEATRAVRGLLRRGRALGWLWTALAVLLPVPLLFGQPFLVNVVLPFMQALGVNGV